MKILTFTKITYPSHYSGEVTFEGTFDKQEAMEYIEDELGYLFDLEITQYSENEFHFIGYID